MMSHNSYIVALVECKRIDLRSRKIYDCFSTSRRIVMAVNDRADYLAHIVVYALRVDQNGTLTPLQST